MTETREQLGESSDLRDVLQAMCVPGEASVMIGRQSLVGAGSAWHTHSPIDGRLLGAWISATSADVSSVVDSASDAFKRWRLVPAPRRGELVRRFGMKLRAHQKALASVVVWEAGKIVSEAMGEVQEMIDICDFAVGLSRQLCGATMASERPMHRLTEQWHPLGPVGIITAFNFPVAVWAWNAALALVCGDPVIWKPSEKTPWSALATHCLLQQTIDEWGEAPAGLSSVVMGGRDVGESLARSPRVALVSATGSVAMGRSVAQTVAARLGRCLLELGGNNGMIVCPSADLELAIRAIVFAAVGTCGQRCTTLRRLIVHESIADGLVSRLEDTYRRLPIGNPWNAETLVGPLVDESAGLAMEQALAAAVEQGGRVRVGGGRRRVGVPAGGYYPEPAIVELDASAPIVQQETFAPILYLHRYRDLEEAMEIHNGVPQGLASAIFTQDMREAEWFCSAAGSDCGIANVNIGTSGAEIGGAFGGEKETGSGRESGSDSWKAYMRRATNTVNYSRDLPLAQGVRFSTDS